MFSWLRKLKRSSEQLHPFESQILRATHTHLDGASGEVFGRQIEHINSVSRLADDMEINLYHLEGRSPSFDESLLFPSRSSNLLLSTVYMRRTGETDRLKAYVWVENGHVFSIQLNRDPTQYFSGMGMEEAKVDLDSVQVIWDPLSPPSTTPARPAEFARLPQWLRTAHADGGLRNLRGPLEDPTRDRLLTQTRTRFPSDYTALLQHMDGCAFGEEYALHGAAAIRAVITDRTIYHLIAESPVAGLAIPDEDSTGTMHLITFVEEAPIRSLPGSLQDALSALRATSKALNG
jgi:hypothetical protein